MVWKYTLFFYKLLAAVLFYDDGSFEDFPYE